MKKFYTIMILVYVLIFFMLIKKTSDKRNVEHNIVNKDDVIRNKCDEPKDFAEEKRISQRQRDYYDYLYENTKQ